MRVRFGLTFHSIYYAPFYMAWRGGHFERAGIDVEYTAYGDGRLVQEALEGGAIDVGLGGIMRSLEMYDRGAATVPVHFARVNDRDGFFLLGRSEQFEWPDLLGKRLLIFSEAPTPRYILRGFLAERGLDADRIDYVTDRPIAELAAAFRAGEGDFFEGPAHVVEDLLRSGSAVFLRSLGEATGNIPYSSYAVQPDVLDREAEMIDAVFRGHAAALDWMGTVDGAAIWDVIRPAFPDAHDEIFRRAVERYQRLGTWSSSPTLDRDTYQRLAELLQRGGLISSIAPFKTVCREFKRPVD